MKKISRPRRQNALAGAADLAVQDAQRFGTNLIIATNGKIKEISPAAMKRQLAKRK